MKREVLRVFACGLLGLLAAGCRTDDDVELPKAPSMSTLIRAYEQPTGALDSESGVLLTESLIAKARDLKAAALLIESVVNAVDGVDGKDDTDASALTADPDARLYSEVEQGLTGSLDLWTKVTWICFGWEGPTAPVDTKWGKVVLNALGNTKGLSDVIWGNLSRCKLLQDDGGQQELSGALKFRFPQDVENPELLFDFEGTWLDPDGKPVRLDLDFALLGETLSVLQTTDAGTFRVQVPLQSARDLLVGGGLQVTDAEGTWSCTATPDLRGGRCSAGGDEVAW
jgi:hypothetical protein